LFGSTPNPAGWNCTRVAIGIGVLCGRMAIPNKPMGPSGTCGAGRYFFMLICERSSERMSRRLYAITDKPTLNPIVILSSVVIWRTGSRAARHGNWARVRRSCACRTAMRKNGALELDFEVFISVIILDGNSKVCFHGSMILGRVTENNHTRCRAYPLA
jgi:hypothetical protein